MNGTEQSDSPIVPRKLANTAARAAAEPMEGSGGTKRNAELQSTVRTQSRAAVSQAQGRIREAVTRNRKERLTALLHHVGTDCLRWAFFNLRMVADPRRGAALAHHVPARLVLGPLRRSAPG